MEYLDKTLLLHLQKVYNEIETLLATEEDPSKPYDLKYKARDKLEDLIQQLKPREETSDHARALLVHFYARLGSVNHDVEELSRSEQVLNSAIKMADSFAPEGLVIIPKLVSLNQLGMLWFSRVEFEKSQMYLYQALNFFKSYHEEMNSKEQNKIHDVQDLLDPNDASSGSPEKEKALESLNMHTFYYLAQVCEKIGEKHKSATFCHITLKKQLELKTFNPIEWSINAFTLSHYYLVYNKFKLAKYHIGSAKFILDKHQAEIDSKEFDTPEEKEQAQEIIDQTFAQIEMAWGRYSNVMLGKSHDNFVQGQDAEDIDDITVEDVTEYDVIVDVNFAGIEIDSSLDEIPTNLATNFEEARAIFLPGQRHLNKAKEHFTFNNHCSDFVEINQDLSVMHKYLAIFEQDLDRRFKIHKRRVDLLEKPLQDLNEKYYLLLCRKLMFELAEVHETMMDAKFDKLKAEGDGNPSPQVIKKINGIIEKSICFFNKFIDSFRTGNNQELPSKFAAENVRPILVAYFHLGRLWDKILVSEVSEQKLQNKIRCLYYHRQMVEYCDANPEAAEVVRNELAPCRELVKLLPIKIEKMRMDLRHS